MSSRFTHLLALACVCLMTYAIGGAVQAAEPVVWVALSDSGGAYAEAAAAVEAEIERAGPGRGEVLVRPWTDFLSQTLPPPRLIVAVGNLARKGMLDSTRSEALLAVMVTRSARDKELADAHGRKHTAVLLAQPPERQLAVLRQALPERTRLGMLFGPDSAGEEFPFRRAAEQAGLRFSSGMVTAASDLGGILQRTLEDSDLLLALADPLVFNNSSVQNILTASYRRRVPLIGFSPAYVKAGALLAIYSTPTQMGRQAGTIARDFLGGLPLPPPQAPRDFVIGINADVARSLGLPLRAEDGEALAAKVRAQEARR